MIFGSFGLLLVAVALLIAAVAKSSVGYGIGSLICTVLAAVMLVLANAYYRKLTHEAQRGEGGEGGDSRLRRLASDGAPGAPLPAEPVPAMATSAMPVVYAVPNGNAGMGGVPGMAAMTMAPPATSGVLDGYGALNATQAAAFVETLGIDDLHAVRRIEIEGAGRKTVLAAIDRRIQVIVDVRKSITSFEG